MTQTHDIAIRWTAPADAVALARVHAEAWRFAYAGIIPGLALERRIAAHGPRWWARMHREGEAALALEVAGEIAGYARLGPSRASGMDGEIYELYLAPAYIGLGFGRRLFDEARRRLSQRALHRLVVWSLADNEAGRRFYIALGGRRAGRARTSFGGETLEQVAYAWP